MNYMTELHLSHRYKNLLEAIGNTPLIRLSFDIKPTILAKLEYLNRVAALKTGLHCS